MFQKIRNCLLFITLISLIFGGTIANSAFVSHSFLNAQDNPANQDDSTPIYTKDISFNDGEDVLSTGFTIIDEQTIKFNFKWTKRSEKNYLITTVSFYTGPVAHSSKTVIVQSHFDTGVLDEDQAVTKWEWIVGSNFYEHFTSKSEMNYTVGINVRAQDEPNITLSFVFLSAWNIDVSPLFPTAPTPGNLKTSTDNQGSTTISYNIPDVDSSTVPAGYTYNFGSVEVEYEQKDSDNEPITITLDKEQDSSIYSKTLTGLDTSSNVYRVKRLLWRYTLTNNEDESKVYNQYFELPLDSSLNTFPQTSYIDQTLKNDFKTLFPNPGTEREF